MERSRRKLELGDEDERELTSPPPAMILDSEDTDPEDDVPLVYVVFTLFLF